MTNQNLQEALSMISYVFDIGERSRKVSRFISHVRSELQSALVAEKSSRKLTQQSIADKIGVNRSVINRQLMGEENLTLRSVADLAWALGWDIDFSLRKPIVREGTNLIAEDSSHVHWVLPATAIVTNSSDAQINYAANDSGAPFPYHRGRNVRVGGAR